MANAPRPGAGRRADAEDAVASFNINGETYTFRFNDVTAKLVSESRRTTGFTPIQLLSAVTEDSLQDLDLVAALVWICRRQAGETVDYDALMDEVTYAWLDTFERTDEEAEVVVGSPEA